ncbi:MAG: peptidylprolyl isomerase [Clostridia bacterium]|nr:peptidylprolyl isomerase [Clostridia bacterium]
MSKKMKRFLSCTLAACGIVACAGTLTACETNNPEVEMKIEFNGETYTLDYKLYRKITPSTVEHFLWLVDGGFYNDTVIHDYDADTLKMYGGLYDYDENETDGDYYKEDKSYAAFCETYKDKFPASVFLDKGETPIYTVYGEFKNNQFNVSSGLLKEDFGTLSMYYHAKDTDSRVYVKRADGNGYSDRDYAQNSATSMFYMTLSTSAKTQNDYCTFATLTGDSKEVLEDFKQAIADYIEENYDEDESRFVTATEMYIDEEDEIENNQDKKTTFDIPNEAIIIKSITVKKY